MYIVYKFVNRTGEVLYVGKSKKFENRLVQHKKGTSSGTKNLMAYVNKIYLKFCSSEFQMDNTERFYINKYKPKGNSTDKYLNAEETIFALYEEDTPWVLFNDDKVSLLDMIERDWDSLKEIGCTIENDKLYRNGEYIMHEKYTLKQLESMEKIGALTFDKENDTKSYLIKYLKYFFESFINGLTNFTLDSHDRKNSEEEIKDIVKSIYECLKNNNIVSPMFRILKKEYYNVERPNEIINSTYSLCILEESYYKYEVIKKYISSCSKQIKNQFRNHLPFKFEMDDDTYFYDGVDFYVYNKWFNLDYIKEVAERKSSRGTGDNSLVILEEYDDIGNNNDSFYIHVKEVKEKFYLSSIDMFSDFFYCHEYLYTYLDDFPSDNDSLKKSIYGDKKIRKLIYTVDEISDILNFDVIRIPYSEE